ncbi:MAG: 4Fe-4S dicluster domain-containing protein [Polyangiaceae bacterium]|nr:4Fe-4S dicluster domain-containing protein [Polyangiaceae bacterium]
MQALQDLARKLLQEKTVGVVVGYEQGPRGVRPVFVMNPNTADRLIFDNRCVHNLAVHLNPRKAFLRPKGKIAVVVKGCDARAVASLIRETQVSRDDVVLIGVRCGGVLRAPNVAANAKLTAQNVADKCCGCDCREPKLVDHLVGELPPAPPQSTSRDEKIGQLEAMMASERWAFWRDELARCVRCYACREVCPTCYCDTCVATLTQPQWIESSAHPQGNFAWQFTRVLHQAGRCADCGECERVCPVGIPLGLLTRKSAQIVEQRFQHRPTDDPGVAAPIGTYRADDQQEFIL